MICIECGTVLSNRTIVSGIAVCGECMNKMPGDQQLPRSKVIEVDFRKIVTKPTPERERR